jgi:uncharacterized protein (TIGR03118 family)
MRSQLRLAVVCAAGGALAVLAGAPAQANSAPPTPHFNQINQVSDQPGKAKIQDPDLVNSWGLALGPTTPLWVADNGTNKATIYAGGLKGAAVTKAPLTVSIPGGAPTGEVFNSTGSTRDFLVKVGTKKVPATFMFDSEGGQITAWSNMGSGTKASVVAHHTGAIYKGLALVTIGCSCHYLLATDFHNGKVDVYDSSFQRVHVDALDLRDPTLPAGYAPFNVMVSGHQVYVTYAKQDAAKSDELHGPGLGFVDVYDVSGAHPVRHRVASHGTLNAPWGLAIAPANFGAFAGALLVGNFGDGHIFAYCNGRFLGALRYPDGHRVHIDGLWALLPGTATTGGVGTLWFSAGPDDEMHGLVGQLTVAH